MLMMREIAGLFLKNYLFSFIEAVGACADTETPPDGESVL